MKQETRKYGLGIANTLFVETSLQPASVAVSGKTVKTEKTIDTSLRSISQLPTMISVADALPATHILISKEEHEITLQSTGAAVAKVLIDVPEDTTVTLRESLETKNPLAAVILIRLAARAHVTYLACSKVPTDTIIHREIIVGEQGTFSIQETAKGSRYKSDTVVYLQGEKASTTIDYRSIIEKEQCIDLEHAVYHEADDTKSTITARPVVADRATLIYQTNIDMPTGCAQMKGEQAAAILVTSPDAIVQAVPHLHISEHTVQCRHGVAITKPQEEQLFYLCSRGISPDQALEQLIQGHLLEP